MVKLDIGRDEDRLKLLEGYYKKRGGAENHLMEEQETRAFSPELSCQAWLCLSAFSYLKL